METGNTLKRMARGGAVFLGGTAAATVLQFAAGILVIRIVSVAEFGAISLAMVVATMVATLGALGLSNGVPRFIGGYQGSESARVIGRVAGSALGISGLASTALALFMYLEASLITSAIGNSEMEPVLRLFALMVVPLSMIAVLNGVFRGLQNAGAKVLFQDIMLYGYRALLFGAVLIVGWGIHAVLAIYATSVWLVFVLYAAYTLKYFAGRSTLRFSASEAGRLVRFSLPLVGVGILYSIVTWVGTLSLGHFHSPTEVAVFNAALRVANVIPVPLAALGFLYLPIASGLFGRGAGDEVGRLYMSTAKWGVFLTLPLLLYIVIDGEFLLVWLFGERYAAAAGAFAALSVGFASHTFFGPNGLTLIASGDSRAPLISTALAAISAALLCTILVPSYGTLGAALATAAAQLVSNTYLSARLFVRYRVHVFTRRHLFPIAVTIAGALAGAVVVGAHTGSGGLPHLWLFLWILVVTASAPFLTRTLDTADLELLGALERKITGKTSVSGLVASWTRGKR